MPTIQPPPMPNIQTPSMPGFPAAGSGMPGQQVIQKQCLSCKKIVSDSSKAGDRCPHCGVVWGYEQDVNGQVTSQSSAYVVGKIVGLLVGVGVVIGIIVKVIQSRM
jgi:hypothetical protein